MGTEISRLLDDVSNALQAKPTEHLVVASLKVSLHSPVENLIQQIMDTFLAIPNYIVMPAKILNDRKFCRHVYSSRDAFRSMPPGQTCVIPIQMYQQVLIYLADHTSKIREPPRNRHMETFTINNTNYDVPTTMWYTFRLNTTSDIYFYVHVYPDGHVSIIIACHYQTDLRSSFKQNAIAHYNKSLGLPAATPQKIEEIIWFF